MTVQPTRTHAPRHAALAALLAVLLLAATSCSNTAEVGAEEEPESALESSAEPSDTTTPSTSSTTETTPTEPEATEESLLELWTAATNAAGLPKDEIETALDEIPATFSEQATGLLAAFIPEGPPTELIYSGPTVSQENGVITITDCLIYDRSASFGSSVILEATATPKPDATWQIDDIRHGSDNCLPTSVNNDILIAYNNFWEARKRYGNPPDPDHPDLDKVLTAEYAVLMRDSLTDSRSKDWNLYEGNTKTHPEVTRVSGPDRVRIADCRDIDPESGVFHSDGERAAGSPPRAAGTRNLYYVLLIKQNGKWLVDGIPEAEFETDCQFAPTLQATTIIG